MDLSLSPLSFLLPYKLDVDTREPVWLLHIQGEEYALYAPSILFWVETLSLVAMQAVLSAGLSIITYKFIVTPQRTSGTTTPLGYLIGYGWILPFWILIPSYQIVAFDIRNIVMKFCLSGISPTIGIFHTTEAMHGFVPPHARTSLRAYTLYAGSPMELVVVAATSDAEPKKHHIRATLGDMAGHLYKFLVFLCLLGVLHSILEPSHFSPFGRVDGPWYSMERLVHPSQLANNLACAVLFQMYLVTFCEGLLAATVILTGYKAEPVMENAILKSTSPSEFWGKRWNKLIHSVLKRGVYLPMRVAVPKSVAMFATFLASGLFHELLLYNIFLVDDHGNCSTPPQDCFDPIYVGSTFFFLWNACLILLEYSGIGKDAMVVRWVRQYVPTPLRSVLVVLLAAPMAHWFCESYVQSSFFLHGGIGFPMVRRVSQKGSI